MLRRPPAKRRPEPDEPDKGHGSTRFRGSRSKAGPAEPKQKKPRPDTTAQPTLVKSRHDVSLRLLTEKFIQLLKESPGGTLDLNQAAETLGVIKRRVYDITNPLKGIHLIKKTVKNKIQWLGCKLPEHGGGLTQCQDLKRRLVELRQEEDTLDELIESTRLHMKQMMEDAQVHNFAYVTFWDISLSRGLQDQTVIVVKAPYGTTLQLPECQEADAQNFQVQLTSSKGPIEAFLCPDEVKLADSSQNSLHVDGNLAFLEECDSSGEAVGEASVNLSSTVVTPASFACLLQQSEAQFASREPFVILAAPGDRESTAPLGDEEDFSEAFDGFDCDIWSLYDLL